MRLIALAGVCVLVVACVGPARTEPQYRADVSNAARTALSAVESANLTVQTVVEGRTTAAYASRRLTEDEKEVQAAITAFGSVQPPSEDMDRLRADVMKVLTAASTVLGDMRIAAFRDDHRLLDEIAHPLPEIASQLGRYENLGGG